MKIRSGVTCDIEDGGWKLSPMKGLATAAQGLGPDPRFRPRRPGTCLAMGYLVDTPRRDLIASRSSSKDYDAVGMYGVDDSVPPGWGASPT